MKKALAILALLSLAALPSLAAQRAIDYGGYRIGEADVAIDDTRIASLPDGVTDSGLDTGKTLTATKVNGQKIVRWWSYKSKQNVAATSTTPAYIRYNNVVTNAAAVYSLNWTYNTVSYSPAYVVVDYDYIKYNLSYDANGGGGTAPSSRNDIVYTNSVTLANNTFTRTGYTWAGWTNNLTSAVWTGGDKVTGSSLGLNSIVDGSNVVLRAKWTTNTYTVTLNANGGTGGTASATATYDAAMPTATMPTRTGCTFQGYYDTSASSGGTQYYTASGTSARTWNKASNATLYARWTANKYTATLNANGGTGGTASATATYDAAMPTATMPTRTGYTFQGYYDTSASSGGTQYYTASGTSARTWNKASNATLYARWTANTYTVTLNQNGGTGGSASATATYDAAMPTATMPTRTGYTFGGYWTGTGGSGTQYYNADGSSTRSWDLTAATTLYAKWTANKYEYRFNNYFSFYTWAGSSSAALNSSSGGATLSVDKDAGAITISAGTKQHIYTKYSKSASEYSSYYKIGISEASAAAGTQWTFSCRLSGTSTNCEVYYVEYDANHEIILNGSYQYHGLGGVAASTGDYVKTFVVSANCRAVQFFFDNHAANTTATWSDLWMHSTSTYDRGVPTPIRRILTYNDNQTVGSLPTGVSRPGYTFSWLCLVNGTATVVTPSTTMASLGVGNKSIYAGNWVANTYTVTLDRQSGTGGSASATATYGAAMPSATMPARTGYTFGGYWTGAGGSGTKYYNADGSSARTWNLTAATTLYAKWTANGYRVQFYANGGDGEMAEQSFTYGAAQALMANGFTRTGYSFQGWATSATGPIVYSDEQNVINLTSENNEVVTLYAKWSLVYYSLTTSTTGTGSGTVALSPSGGSYTNGTVVVVTATPATGSSFTRWSDGVTDNPRTYTMTSNALIAVVFTVHTFTVTFEDEDGAVLLVQDCNYGATMPYPDTNPTRTGYRFLGWTPTPPATVTQTAVYTARYEAKSYTVRFHSNYGAGAAERTKDQSFTYGTPQNLSSVSSLGFAKPGYTFTGWKTQNGDQIYDDGGQVLNLAESGVVDLFAQWTPNAYTVTFDANGGTGEMADMNLVYDVETNLTANGFSKTGCAFSGWATSANGPAKYADGAAVSNLTATANGTYPLYAKWTANTYTVTLDPQGGTGGTGRTNVTYASALPRITVPARTGYTFGGYYAEPSGGGVQYYTQSGSSAHAWDIGNDATLYAKWTANDYKVAFHGNGGIGSMPNQDFTYDVAQGLASNCFVKTGYSFGGWATNSSTAVMYADKAVVSNLTATAGGWVDLYAKWRANAYAVTLDANGGSVSPTSTNVTYDATYGALPTPTWIGHTFGGWYTSDIGGSQVTAGTTVSITAAQTLYAHWTTNHFTVSFDANGGTGSMTPQNFTYDVAQNLTSNRFLKTGYTFGGWATDSASTYSDGQLVSNLTATAGGAVTLSAIWTPHSYYIVFDGQGADDGETMDMMVLEGNVTTNLTACTFAKTGYTFGGWATNETDAATLAPTYANCAEVESVELGAPLDETNVFYAVWQANTYTVVFNANGGTGTMENQAFVYDQGQALTKRGFKSNLNFVGWATNQTGDVVFEDEAIVSNLTAVASGEVTLYAVWDNGELSAAMHCDNLYWVQVYSGDGRWGAVKGEDEGYNPSGSSLTNAVVAYTITQSYALKPSESSVGSGNLSFWYKMSASGSCALIFQANTTNESLVANKVWQKFGPVYVDDITSVAIGFVRQGQVTRTVWIDQMTWEPAGLEPTEKDKPTISAFTVRADGFTLTVDPSNISDSFSYQILATNELVSGDWPVKETLSAEKLTEGYSVIPEAGEPTMFYKVKVIAK